MRWFKCSCGNEFPEEAQNISDYRNGQCPSCGSDDVEEVNGEAVRNTQGIWKNLPTKEKEDEDSN